LQHGADLIVGQTGRKYVPTATALEDYVELVFILRDALEMLV
jgi:hypothetical protein